MKLFVLLATASVANSLILPDDAPGVCQLNSTGSLYCECDVNTVTILYNKTVEIREGVTHVERIKDCQVTSMKFPDSLESLGQQAFMDKNLESLDLSNTKIENISYLAFAVNLKLASVQFPSTLKSIETGAFTGSNMTTLDLSGTQVEELIDYTFSNSPQLTTAVFPSSLTSVQSRAFQYSPLASVTFNVLDCDTLPTIEGYEGAYTYLKDGKVCGAGDECDTDDSATYINNQCCTCTS